MTTRRVSEAAVINTADRDVYVRARVAGGYRAAPSLTRRVFMGLADRRGDRTAWEGRPTGC